MIGPQRFADDEDDVGRSSRRSGGSVDVGVAAVIDSFQVAEIFSRCRVDGVGKPGGYRSPDAGEDEPREAGYGHADGEGRDGSAGRGPDARPAKKGYHGRQQSDCGDYGHERRAEHPHHSAAGHSCLYPVAGQVHAEGEVEIRHGGADDRQQREADREEDAARTENHHGARGAHGNRQPLQESQRETVEVRNRNGVELYSDHCQAIQQAHSRPEGEQRHRPVGYSFYHRGQNRNFPAKLQKTLNIA